MKRILCIALLIMTTVSLEANFLEDLWEEAKNVVNTVVDGCSEAIDWVKERFGDTQVTRSVDYGIRMGALLASQAVAQGILEASQQITDVALVGSYEAANLAVTASEEFLDKVVRNVAIGTLEASQQTASGVLKAAETSTVGILEGTRWVVNTTLGAIDINCIHYDGNLRDFEALNLGRVLVRGQLINPFEITTSLDLKDPLKSAGDIALGLGKMMQSAFLDPKKEEIAKKANVKSFDEAMEIVADAGQDAASEKSKIGELQPSKEYLQAEEKIKKAQRDTDKIKEELVMKADDARERLRILAEKTFDELIAFVNEQGTEITRETTLAKQELARRLRKKRKEILEAAASATPSQAKEKSA